jgi:hypothetical protein
MIVEMLAADEVYPRDRDALRATGFLARNYYIFNRDTWLEEVVEHTNRAFLGVTMQCAKCHDHKYDPVGQLDYYRMRAIFEPHQVRTDRVGCEHECLRHGSTRRERSDLAEWGRDAIGRSGNPEEVTYSARHRRHVKHASHHLGFRWKEQGVPAPWSTVRSSEAR